MARKLTRAHLEKMRKGREAAAKMREKKHVSRKKVVSRGTVKKATAKRRVNPVTKHAVKITARAGVGYLSGWTLDGPMFDTELSKSLGFSEHDAKLFMISVFSNRSRIKGFERVEVVKK